MPEPMLQPLYARAKESQTHGAIHDDTAVRLVQQLARTHPKTITKLAQKDTGSSANRHMRQILRIYNGASREMSLPLKN